MVKGGWPERVGVLHEVLPGRACGRKHGEKSELAGHIDMDSSREKTNVE